MDPERERRTIQVIFKCTASERRTLGEGPALAVAPEARRKLKWSEWARGVLLAEVARLKAERAWKDREEQKADG